MLGFGEAVLTNKFSDSGSRADPAFVSCINPYRRKAAVAQRDFHWDAAERHRQTSRRPVTDQRVAETDVDRGQQLGRGGGTAKDLGNGRYDE